MSDISAWSPVDESNNAAPPAGWPEFMNPSDVNNCARAMMGAIRRNYDAMIAGTVALPYVSLSGGGAVTGNISATGNIAASGNLSANNLAISTYANVTGPFTAGAVTTPNIHATNGAIVDGELDVTTIVASGITTTNAHVTNGLTVDATLTTSNLGAALVTTTNLTVNNNANVAGTLFAGAVTAPVITGTTRIDTGTYQIGGANFAGRGSDALGTANVIYDGGGQLGLALYGPGGTLYRCDNAHFFTNRGGTLNICRFQASDGNCINASGLWNVVSEASLKTEVEPYTAGLAALRALTPISFRYTEKSPFGAGEKHYGLAVDEVEAVLPEMVGHLEDDGTDYRTVAPGHLVFVLLNCVRELEARLVSLEEERRHV